MTYHGTTNDFAKMKSDVNALKTHLRRHQISMGDDKVDYTSDYRRGYRDMPADTYMQGDRKKELQKVREEIKVKWSELIQSTNIQSSTSSSRRSVLHFKLLLT